MRRMGTIAALDLKVADPGYLAGIGPQLMAFALARGILLRPLGNTLYWMPPYCIGDEEITALVRALDACLS